MSIKDLTILAYARVKSRKIGGQHKKALNMPSVLHLDAFIYISILYYDKSTFKREGEY